MGNPRLFARPASGVKSIARQSMTQKIVPPFTEEAALVKVQAAENLWNTRDPEKVVLGYTPDSVWRNRAEFLNGRDEIKAFLRRKWDRELDYRLRKTLWTFN